MKSILRRRPTPALVISCVALFVSLGGVSYGVATGFIDSREIKNNQVRSSDLRNNSIRTFDIRNNEVRGFDIRNSSVQGRDVALNTLTGADISEEDLAQVPDAAALGGKPAGQYVDVTKYIPLSAKLAAGETRILATNGTVSIEALCDDSAGASGTDDQLRVLASTTGTQAVLEGLDDLSGGITYLTSATLAANRRLAQSGETPNGEVSVQNPPDAATVEDEEGGFVIGPDGKGLLLELDSLALGVNYAGSKCFVAGLIVPIG